MSNNKKSTPVSTLAGENLGASPDNNQGSNPREEKFIDYTERNISELNKKVFSKFNLSDSMIGLCLYHSEITRPELVQRTSETFASSFPTSDTLSKSTWFYEYYVHVNGISDYINLLSTETLETYLKLRDAQKELVRTKLEDFSENDELYILKKKFKNPKHIKEFLQKAEQKIKGFHRFYSSQNKYFIENFACLTLARKNIRVNSLTWLFLELQSAAWAKMIVRNIESQVFIFCLKLIISSSFEGSKLDFRQFCLIHFLQKNMIPFPDEQRQWVQLDCRFYCHYHLSYARLALR